MFEHFFNENYVLNKSVGISLFVGKVEELSENIIFYAFVRVSLSSGTGVLCTSSLRGVAGARQASGSARRHLGAQSRNIHC